MNAQYVPVSQLVVYNCLLTLTCVIPTRNPPSLVNLCGDASRAEAGYASDMRDTRSRDT